MHVIVLGAGVVGTTTAWFLRAAGHDVTVLDRQPTPGIETSFANGGQISVSHAEPWANPSAPWKTLKWLFRDDAPLLFRPRADWRQWRWCLQFLRECTPARTRRNIAQIVALGLYSRSVLQSLRKELGIEYDHLEKGILHFYTNPKEFQAAQTPAQVMRDHGCDLEMLSPDEVVQIEPSLAPARHKIVGGSMTYADESGDARKFTQALARHAGDKGVQFLQNTHIHGLNVENGRISGVRVRRADGSYGLEKADAYVVCLGSYSPLLLRPLGIDLSIYPTKGYSVTLPVSDPSRAYTVSLTDDEFKLVFSRLGNRLRIAGTAELNGYTTDINQIRCEAILRRVNELFPGVADLTKAEFWTGLRPTTPSNVPYIGKTRYRNLFLNTGHGTLGWTHSCGSSRALADILSGKKPRVQFAFTGMGRAMPYAQEDYVALPY